MKLLAGKTLSTCFLMLYANLCSGQFITSEGDTIRFGDPNFDKFYKEYITKIRLENRSIYDSALQELPLNTKSLTLSNADYPQVPARLLDFKELEKLNLKGNQLGRIPKKLHKLKQLKYLDLSSNVLAGKKIKFKKMKQLEYLDLSHSQLEALPKGLRKLKNLEVIKLDGNQIFSLGKLFKNKELESLSIASNPLKMEERNFRKGYDSLRFLNLYQCSLQYLPESIGNLKSLVSLKAPKNQIKSLPESIGKLDSLVGLILYKNEIEVLPKSLFLLKNLIHLDIYYNKVKEIPEEIKEMKSLEEVYFSFNQIEKLPESMGELPIKYLYLHDNLLTTIPYSFQKLATLEMLHLHNNRLTSIPLWVYNFTELKEFTLSYNPLISISEKVFDMPNLKLFEATSLSGIEEGTKESEALQQILETLKEKGVNVFQNQKFKVE